jgi:hypothetical protein
MKVASAVASSGGVDDDHRDDVGEERQRQVFETAKDRRIGEAELQHPDHERYRHEEPHRLHVAAGQERSTCRDGAEVGSDVDRIRTEDQDDACTDQHRRELAPERGAEADARLQRDACAGLLHGDHQREGEDGQPERPETKLAPGLGVGTDAGGVIVRCAGDEPWTQQLEEPERTPAARLVKPAPSRRRRARGGLVTASFGNTLRRRLVGKRTDTRHRRADGIRSLVGGRLRPVHGHSVWEPLALCLHGLEAACPELVARH